MTRTVSAAAPTVDDATAERLAAALRCATVSREDHTETDPAEFDRLTAHLEHCFPLVHTHLDCETFGHSRLYRWTGAADGPVTTFDGSTRTGPATDADSGGAVANRNTPAGGNTATPPLIQARPRTVRRSPNTAQRRLWMLSRWAAPSG